MRSILHDATPAKLLQPEDSQIFQVLDGQTLTDRIATQAEVTHHEVRPSRLTRFSSASAKTPTGNLNGNGGSMTITWLNNIYLNDLASQLNFPESLLMITESGSTVGKYYCSVKKAVLMGKQCFLVHFGSCSTLLDGLEVGLSVTGFVDNEFQTIQEFTHEWQRLDGKTLTRKFILMRESDKYFCRNTVWENGVLREADCSTFTLDLGEMRRVITESANVLLHRVIILQRKTGQIELSSLTLKGQIVQTTFRALGDGVENVRGEQVNVLGVRRTIYDGKVFEEWDSIFNDYGRMVLRCQTDQDHALIPLWFKAVEKYAPSGEFIGARPPLVWACDMEMYAQYVERKDLLVSQNKNYLLKHPLIKALLSDFLKAVLLRKPKKVVEFGRNFFEPFLRRHLGLELCLSDSDSELQDDDHLYTNKRYQPEDVGGYEIPIIGGGMEVGE